LIRETQARGKGYGTAMLARIARCVEFGAVGLEWAVLNETSVDPVL